MRDEGRLPPRSIHHREPETARRHSTFNEGLGQKFSENEKQIEFKSFAEQLFFGGHVPDDALPPRRFSMLPSPLRAKSRGA